MNWTTQYDSAIRAAAAKYLPLWDWRWLKAQLIAESALDPKAKSGAGALGIAQFMPPTWSDVREILHFPDSATTFDPQYAIPGAAWYLSKIRSWWTSFRTEDDRRRLVQASYNAGFGSITAAQRAAEKALGRTVNDYAGIVAYLPNVTGKRAQETTDYVTRIDTYYNQLAGASA